MKSRLLWGAGLLLTRGVLGAPAHQPAEAPNQPTLEFIENRGQWDGRARYAAPLPGGARLFAEADGLTFALLADGGPAQHRHGGPTETAAPPAAETAVRGHALTLRFAGAEPAATLRAETPTAEHRSYFVGNDPARWAADVRSYRTLRYGGLWSGVDARVYESADQHVEYDFELAAGADPAAIGLRHEGADGLALDPTTGSLLVRTSAGTLTERAPQAWQTDAAGRRRAVACRYALAGPVLRFVLGKYDHSRPLTIDPVVVFATYTGSVADNWGFTAAYDPQGNLYSGGIAFGAGYPASPGAFRTTFAGLIDIAIIKYNTGVSGPAARAWATYLGGSGADFPSSLVVNSLGQLLVLGASGSADYPTTAGALQRTYGGGTTAEPFGYSAPYSSPTGSDLVITRLAANGTALVGSTFLGGSGNDGLLPLDPAISPFATVPQLAHNYGDPFRGDILVDAADNVYIASHTTSANFPVAGGLDGAYRGGASDGVVCKLTPGLTALTWASFLGGSGADAAYSLQLEPGSGDVYVAGGTLSANFPVTAGAYRTARPGRVDGFAVRLAANGQSLLRATYVGTAAYDQAYFLQLGTDGGVYLLGQTAGSFPFTPGLYRTPNGTQFIQKLDANLTTSLLSTVFGAASPQGQNLVNLAPTAFLVDRCDRVYVCGWGGMVNQNAQGGSASYLDENGTTTGLPTTPDAAQTATDGSDFYLAQFAAGLTALAYGTFYGNTDPNSSGEHVDGGTSRFDPRGIVYQAVCSCFSTAGFPVPPGVNTYSATNNSGGPFGSACNNAAFVLDFQPSIASAGAAQTVCATAGPQALVGSPGGGIWAGPGVSGSAATGFVFTPTPALAGVQTLTYTVPGTGLCTTSSTRVVTVTPPPTVVFTPLLQATYCLGAAAVPPVALTATPAGGAFSGPGVSGSVTTGFVFAPSLAPNGPGQIVYTLSVGGCVAQAAQTVTVVRLSAVSAGADQAVCATAGPQALAGTPAGGTFSGPGVSGSVAAGFVFTPSLALLGAQTLTYTVLIGGICPATATRSVVVTSPPAVSFPPLPQAVYCVSATGPAPTVPLTATPAGGAFSGPGVSGSVAAGFVFAPALAPAGSSQLVYTLNIAGCVAQATQAVTVVRVPAASAGADTVLCAGSAPFRLRGTPAGGTFSGPGVSGSVAAGFVFTPPAAPGPASTLTYSLVSAGCPATATRQVSVAPVPGLLLFADPVACAETRRAPLTMRFVLTSSINFSSFSRVWDFGDGTQSTEISPTHTYARPGRYQPTVRVRYNLDRCEVAVAGAPVEVQARVVPNVITPNGDPLNQTFRVGPDCAPRLQVFSRWGQLVFEAAAYQDNWDAAGQPAGTYYYLLSYPDGVRLKGWVEVVR